MASPLCRNRQPGGKQARFQSKDGFHACDLTIDALDKKAEYLGVSVLRNR
jgi:hypothetical protein